MASMARRCRRRRVLNRFLATWSDGVTLVLHAPSMFAAYDLARRLEPPAVVRVTCVAPVTCDMTQADSVGRHGRHARRRLSLACVTG